VESPFADDNIQRLNNFIRETGITGKGAWALAEQILSYEKADYDKDPLTALAVSKILDDKGYASLGVQKLREREAKRLGIDATIPYEELTQEEKDTLLYESVGALKKIDEAKNKFASKQDIFSSLRSQRETAKKAAEENGRAWDNLAPQVAGKISDLSFEIQDDELGAIKVPFAVSKEQVEAALKQVLPILKQTQLAGEEGAKYLEAVLKNSLQSANAAQRDKELVKAIRGKVREALIKEKVNGDPVQRKDKEGNPVKHPTFNDTLAAERKARTIQ
jgi:hypothetical protein